MSTRNDRAPVLVLIVAALLTLAAFMVAPSGRLEARSGGIDGYSGNPSTGGEICTACHSGGIAPMVTLSGPTLVEPGTTQTYTLVVSGGQQIAAGLDVSVTEGTLAITDLDTYLRNGEVTHRDPRAVDANGNASWSFDWNVPATEGTAVIYGAGNSVNLANGNNGDLADADLLVVTIAAITPGESSGDGADPLLVTGYDPMTGNLSLGYEPGCSTSDNHIYYGQLDSVSSHAWSGESCSIGTGGAVSQFNPGPGSYFFVIVGSDGVDEGSYGRALSGGSESERPAYGANTCGTTQNLADRCD